jgi:hypothetical protein
MATSAEPLSSAQYFNNRPTRLRPRGIGPMSKGGSASTAGPRKAQINKRILTVAAM